MAHQRTKPDKAPSLIFLLLALDFGFLSRRFLFCFVTIAAFLFLTRPVFSQETQKQPPSDSTAPPVEAKPAGQPSAQNNPKDQTSQAPKTTETTEKKKSDRMFYVMPNYLTVDNQSQVPSINWKEKFSITLKGTFDPYEFVIVGVMVGAVFPSILKQILAIFDWERAESVIVSAMPPAGYSSPARIPVVMCSTFPSFWATPPRLAFPTHIIRQLIGVFRQISRTGDCRWASTPSGMS